MQIIFIVLAVLMLITFAAPIFHKVFNFGNAIGIFSGAALLTLGVLWQKFEPNVQLYLSIFICFVLLVMVVFMSSVYNAGRSNASNQGVIIVLGCRVKGDKPSRALLGRADAAYRYLVANPGAVAILSGGQGKDEDISEAECIRRILYDRGILNNRLILEDKSTTTDENIRFSLELMKKLGLDTETAAIATSEYHQKRAQVICAGYGIDATAQSARTMPILLPTFLLREVFGLIKAYFTA